MSLPCLGSPVTLQECTPMCSRWTSINLGEPIKYFHDTTNWDPNCYNAGPGQVGLNEPDPQAYLQPAIDAWQSGYPCNTLFERTFNRAEANLVIQYATGDGTVAGNATCFCDNDDDVCVRQVDQTAGFAGSNSVMNIFCNSATGGGYSSLGAFINLYMHELGHVLGMGHVRNQTPAVTSVMGNPANLNVNVVLYAFDEGQLQDRYPCNCTLSNALQAWVEPSPQHVTSDHCPGCLMSAYL